MNKSFKISDIFKTDWSQITTDQAAILLSLQAELLQATQQERFEDCGVTIFKIMAIICKNNWVFKKLSGDQIRDCYTDIDLYQKHWYHFHVNYIDCKGFRLLCPDEKLLDINFEQLVDADSNYSIFLTLINESPENAILYLDKLIAALYRIDSGKGIKKTYNQKLSDPIQESLPKQLTFEYKYLILRTYANCRNYLVSRFPDLFPASSSEEDSKPQKLSKMWHDMLCDLGDTTAFPGMKTAKKAPVYEALYYLNKKVKEGKELQEKYRKNGHTNS